MKKRAIAVAAAVAVVSVTGVFAQDRGHEAFISLTRKAEPMENLPSNVSTITFEEIKKSGAKSVGEAIDSVAGIELGIYGTAGAQSSIIMRGAVNEQVLVLVDGHPANDITLGGYNFSELGIENIERVEIIKGAASSIYGANALAGVINIITRETCLDKAIVDVSASVEQYNQGEIRANYAKKSGKIETNVSASRLLARGFRENSGCNNNNMGFYLGFDSGGLGMLKVKGNFARNRLGIPGRNSSPVSQWNNDIETKAYDPGATQETDRAYLSVSSEKTFEGGRELTVFLFGNTEDGKYTSPVAYIEDKTEKTSCGVDIRYRMSRCLVAGGELKEDAARRTDMLGGITGYDEKIAWASVYAQLNIFPAETIDAIAGVRCDKHDIFGMETNPQLTLVWKPRENLKLSSNMGRSYRAPSFEDMFSPYSSWPAWGIFPGGDTQGNRDLKPERSCSFDVAAEIKFGRNAVSQVTVFAQDIDNLIEWSNISADTAFESWRPSNVSQAANRGIELELRQGITGAFSCEFNLTLLDSKGKKSTETDYSRLMYRPDKSSNLSLSYEMPGKTTVSLQDRYVGEQEDDTGRTMQAYNLIGLRIEKYFANYTSVFVSLDNLMNARYFARAGYPLPGRTFKAGFHTTF